MTNVTEPVLEVVVTSAAEAGAAVAGGAHRLEVAADMHADGVTPPSEVFAQVRNAVSVPLRVMLRDHGGFQAHDLEALRTSAEALRSEGAEEFVIGFLTPDGGLDLTAMAAVLDVLPGARWTFHRAVDHAKDRDAVRRSLDQLPGVDTVLTAGCVSGVADGLSTLMAEAHRSGEPGYRVATMAGGGLKSEHVPTLLADGIRAFHVGTSVRPQGWDSPVDSSAVRRWRDLVETAAPDGPRDDTH
jgi:copper homeostasis protein